MKDLLPTNREDVYIEWDEPDRRITTEGNDGVWTPYNEVAILKLPNSILIHFTDHWLGSIPPTHINKILEVIL